jgi:hypothetical protein
MNLTPSGAHRWMKCTGYPSLSKASNIPYERSDSEKEGVAAHEILEQIIKGTPLAITADVDMVMGANLLKAALPAGVKWIVEGPVVIMNTADVSIKGKVDIYGYEDTADIVHIYDYKYGFTPVEVIDNWQLIIYAIGVRDSLIRTNAGTLFSLNIVQPRAYHEDGVIRNWTITMAELNAYAQRVYDTANKAAGFNSSCTTGATCKYCPAAHCCEALRLAALHTADEAYTCYEELPDEAIGRELSLLLDAKTLLDARVQGLQDDMTHRLKQGKLLTGFTLTPGRSSKKWNASDAEIIALGSLMGVQVSSVKVITPTQAVSAGLDKDLVAAYSTVISGALGLAKIKGSLTKIFG